MADYFPLEAFLVVLAAIFASTSALNATTYASTRVSFALGRDGHLPSIFGHISKKTRIPDVALFFSGGITIIIAAVFNVEPVMAGASIFFIILFNIVTFYGMKIRLERGHELQYGFLTPFFPLIPIISIIGRTLIGIFILDMAVLSYIIAGTWLAFGIGFYLLYPKRKSSPWKHEGLKISEEEETRARPILVALSNPETSSVLLKYAKPLVESQPSGSLALMTIVQVPYQTPVEIAEQFTHEAKHLLNTTADSVTSKTPVHRYLRYAHNSAEGVIQSVRTRNAKLLVLGWRGFTKRKYFRMGSTLCGDPVVEKTSCDLVVIKPGKGEPDRPIRKILCPTKGKGPHGKLTWDIVKPLAATFGAEVTIMHVTPAGKTGTIPEQVKKAVSMEYEGIQYQVKIMQSANPVAEILEESKGYDLVVIGTSESSVFQRILFGSKPRKIAENCSCWVMMVRKNTGIRSWFKRWFV